MLQTSGQQVWARCVRKFSFQIGLDAKFKRVPKLAFLRAKLFGKPPRERRALAFKSATPTIPKTYGSNRGLGGGGPRKGPPPAAPQHAPMPVRETSTSDPNQIEYKSYLISAKQTGDRSWIATYIRIGSEPEAADDLPPLVREMNSFAASFIAVASAELEIDELEKKSVRK